MARKFVTPIDFQQLELLRPRLEQRLGDPTSGVEGQLYWNTTTDKVRVCSVTGAPGTWVDMLSGGVTTGDIVDGTIMNADINASAAIALSKLAVDPLARANHTGTQLASTISNFHTQVRTSSLSQTVAPTADVPWNSKRITGLLDLSAAQDAATKNYVDNAIQGLDALQSVRVASTATVTISAPGTAIDGITLANGDGVLSRTRRHRLRTGCTSSTGQRRP